MKFLNTIVALLLALLVLVSSSSFNVNMHYCSGHVQSISFIEEAASCPMEIALPSCHKMMMKKNGCCEDNQLIFEGKDFSASLTDFSDFHFITGSSISDFPFIMEIILVEETLASLYHTAYKPPLVGRNIPVLVQSFLI